MVSSEVREAFREDCSRGLRDVGRTLETGTTWEAALATCLLAIVTLLAIGESWRRVFGEVGGGDVGGRGWSWSAEPGFTDLLPPIGFWPISARLFVVQINLQSRHQFNGRIHVMTMLVMELSVYDERGMCCIYKKM